MECRKLASWLVAAMIAGTAVGCSSLGGAALEERVAAASSAGDHAAIAALYRAEAEKARGQGAEHRRLAAAYGRYRSMSTVFAARAREHCEALATLDAQRAERLDGLAAEHEDSLGP